MVVAAALATAGLGFGIGLANAQAPTTTTPPTTVAPDGGSSEAPPTPEDREHCPDKDGTGRRPHGGDRMVPAPGGGGASQA